MSEPVKILEELEEKARKATTYADLADALISLSGVVKLVLPAAAPEAIAVDAGAEVVKAEAGPIAAVVGAAEVAGSAVVHEVEKVVDKVFPDKAPAPAPAAAPADEGPTAPVPAPAAPPVDEGPTAPVPAPAAAIAPAPSGVVVCSSCGATLPTGANFCPADGAPAVAAPAAV